MKQIKKIVLLLVVMLSVVAFYGVNKVAAADPVTGLTQTKASDTSLSVQWQGNLSAKYYGIQISSDPSFATVSKQVYIMGTDYGFYSLPAGSEFYVRVGWGTTSKNCYSNFTQPLQVVTAPSKVLNSSFTGATDNSAHIEWAPVAGATSYIVQHGYDLKYPVQGTAFDIPFAQGSPSYAYVYAVKTSQTGFQAIGNLGGNVDKLTNLSMNISKDNFGIASAFTSINVYNFGANYAGHGLDLEVKSTKGGKSYNGTTTGSQIRMDTLARNYMYKYRVRAYATATDGHKIYGNWSIVRYICCPKSMKYSRSGAGIQMKWSKLKGVSRIVVKTSTKENTGYKTIAKLKGSTKSYTARKCGKKKMKKGKSYYVRVEYQYKSGKKYYTSDVYSTTGKVYLYK